MPDPIIDVDYRTHILIGVEASGHMTVICHWPYVPRQVDVQNQIGNEKAPYAKFLLCTPTSVLLPPGENAHAIRHGPFS
jgi:hypothetical protein